MTEAQGNGGHALTHIVCSCVSMDAGRLGAALHENGLRLGEGELSRSHPHLFSSVAVFAERGTLEVMRKVVAAVERVAALPAYQEQALRGAHAHAAFERTASGVFMGFDFHLGKDGPQLIEINTNAGGALLNVLLRRAQRACCEPVAQAVGNEPDVTETLLRMFRREHAKVSPGRALASIAIVDDEPERQYLYPEFLLFQHLFERAGVHAVVCAPEELRIEDGKLVHDGRAIDFVYNRLTDFMLAAPAHGALAEALARGLATVSPLPRAHVLFADKRRLITLSDPAALRVLGASEPDIELLQRHVPETREVEASAREALWSARKTLFFKPHAGYGSKAAYRGDKLTQKVFEDILAGGYVSQRLVPPSERMVSVEGEEKALKLDIRNFSYEGEVQLVCARLYQGQTTNFRTVGGGFAPVYPAPLDAPRSSCDEQSCEGALLEHRTP